MLLEKVSLIHFFFLVELKIFKKQFVIKQLDQLIYFFSHLEYLELGYARYSTKNLVLLFLRVVRER